MEESCNVNLVTFFGDVIKMMSLKWRHNWFFKVRFRYNQFEKPNLAKSCNFRSPKSMIKRGARGGEHPALGDFW